MQALKELLLKENERIKGIKKLLDVRLDNIPDGTLRITTTGNRFQFIHCVEDENKSGYKLTYIRKEDLNMARRLAQKSYDQKVKRIVDRRYKQLDKLLKDYRSDEIEDIYNRLHPLRKQLIQPVEMTWKQRVANWKSLPYEGKHFKEGQMEIYTKKGERVRSKSEKILADMFYDMGIEYKYECPLVLKGFGTVYPDFTFLSKTTYEEIYWEHEGMMDEAAYAEKAIRKIDLYTRNNIIPGQRLILTYESSTYALNTSVAEMLIKEYLL